MCRGISRIQSFRFDFLCNKTMMSNGLESIINLTVILSQHPYRINKEHIAYLVEERERGNMDTLHFLNCIFYNVMLIRLYRCTSMEQHDGSSILCSISSSNNSIESPVYIKTELLCHLIVTTLVFR
jgi:hypothetical protein